MTIIFWFINDRIRIQSNEFCKMMYIAQIWMKIDMLYNIHHYYIYASPESQTRVYCLEGNYPNRWSTNTEETFVKQIQLECNYS
mgnify:FL=1